jgi:hypothetical protein
MSLLAGTILVAAYTCGAVHPFVEEVKCNCDGTFSATFGYRHKGYRRSNVGHGPTNKLAGADSVYSRSKPIPTEFEPGEKRQAFSVRFSGERVKWVLGGDSATALADSADFSCISDVPEGAVEVALSDLASTTRLLPDFDSSRIELGKPYRLFVVSPESRDSFAPGDNIWTLISGSEVQWLFPLRYGDETIGEIVIHRRNGRWTSLRGGGCSRSFAGIRRSWPGDKGYSPFLVRMPYSYYDEYWFVIPEKGGRNLTKVKSMDEPTIQAILTGSKRQARKQPEYSEFQLIDSVMADERRAR